MKTKMKTKKSVAKRIKLTGSNKMKRKCTNRSHMAHSKTTKQKRQLRKDRLVSPANHKKLKYTLQGE